jgi:hypothetical protein
MMAATRAFAKTSSAAANNVVGLEAAVLCAPAQLSNAVGFEIERHVFGLPSTEQKSVELTDALPFRLAPFSGWTVGEW